MLKRLALATALFASAAWAQQEVSLTAQDIESGAADAKLAALGREAAATGREVVINAPKEWHGKVAAKVKAGGKAEVKLNDSFFENVVVRVSEKAKAAEPPKPVEPAKPVSPTPAPAPKPAEPPKPAPAPAAPPKPVQPEPKPAPVPPPPAPEPAPAPVTPPPAAPTPPPAPVAKPAEPVKAAPAADPVAAAKQRLEQSLNEGKEAMGELDASQLVRDDVIYVDGPVKAVTRRERLRSNLYWLNGDINLQRAELKPLAANRYQVMDKLVASENASLRTEAPAGPLMFTGKVPAEGDAERASLEKAYGEGRSVTRTVRTDQLRRNDTVYVGKDAAIVVRRDGSELVRYWLDGEVDLNQRGLQKDGAAKYRVISDTVK
ncbi:hypothetical protein [Tahibacter amnicola]|uniref:Organic solvent tolerance-like N-terminal domain-containing protein n=1 Tax=Tahibacter amnicola TaxID=2976241 RepID=A0ABY6BKW2_9GAMM|nr:hypothetical protein [Tahibacter amnicola]UXI70404.1 hypothetical protein N4264_12440 [Tahibacter amnicola]